MHVRHRNGPGNVYRSNTIGVGGMAAASRISSEVSMKGQRMYNTEYRNNTRGYGRGSHSKQSPRLPRETDVFMEAGRLAAEYLVSKGVLPSNTLSGKWLNDDVKDRVSNIQGFREHEVDKAQIAADGRASAHPRLGNASLEAGPGRRRSSDEYDPMGSRLSFRGRKRTGPFRNGGSEMKRELGSGSWVETSGASPGIETGNDGFVAHHAQQPGGVKDGMQSSSPGEVIQEVDGEVPIKSGLDKCHSVGDMHASNGALNSPLNLPSDADGKPIKRSDDANEFNDVCAVPKEDRNEDNLQPKHVENKLKSFVKDDTLVSEDHVDLAKHCKFVNIPTKTRSSLTKGPKGVQNPMNEDGKMFNRELLKASGAQVMTVSVGSTSCDDISHQNHELKNSQSDVSNDPSMEEELGVTYSAKQGHSLRAGSFPEMSVYKEKEVDEAASEFQSPNSMFMERGAKRAIDYTTDGREDSKRIKQGVSPVDAQSDESSPLSSSVKNQPPLQEPSPSQSALGTAVVSDHKIFDISLIPKSKANSCEFMEERQLFPGSFKTCDLNLSGTCDVTENHEVDPMVIFPSVTQPGEEGAPIDVDLSVGKGNNRNLPDKNCKHGVKDIDIEVIDLENDSVQVHRAFIDTERRADTLFNDLDGFPNNMHNANGIPDVQDGYGLMISELLGNDSPSCSSVRTDLNSLNNHMGLANTEGMLDDDDSIYMSLGEIPISLLGPWEQPMQDYGKPF